MLLLSFYFQIYILIRDPRITLHLEENPNSEKDLIKESILVISILSSLCSLAWSLVVYHRSLRYSLAEKNNLNATGSILQFLWHLSSITARVIGNLLLRIIIFFVKTTINFFFSIYNSFEFVCFKISQIDWTCMCSTLDYNVNLGSFSEYSGL